MGQSHNPSKSHCSLAAFFKNLLVEALQTFSCCAVLPVTFSGTCPAFEHSRARNKLEGKMLEPQLPCGGLMGGGLQPTVGAEEKSLVGGQQSKH